MFLEGGKALSRKEVGKILAKMPGMHVLSFQKKRLEGVSGWVVRPRDEITEIRLQEVARLLKANGTVHAGNSENGRVKQQGKKISKQNLPQVRPFLICPRR